MISINFEKFEDNISDLDKLMRDHHNELVLNQDKVSFSPQYNEYIRREQYGALLFAAVRENSKLIGYFVGFVAYGLHHSECLICHQDILYIKPEYRKEMLGLKLLKFVENKLKELGVQRWIIGSKQYADAGALFKRIGAIPEEIIYSKWLGD